MLNPEEHKELIAIDQEYKELCILDAYSSFWAFCLYMDYGFYYSRRAVLEDIANTMQNLLLPNDPEDEIDEANVSICPRTGKSYITTLYASWSLGHFPQESIMRNSVTAKLYDKFSGDLLDIMQGNSHDGRYLDVFSVEFATTAKTGWKLKGAKQGVSYFGAGVGGSIIGFGCSLVSILDDSVKNEEEALSELQLDKKWGWYTSTMRSREEKGCKKLYIGTRWSTKDIIGRLEASGVFGEKYKNIVIPALNENDESFCEEIHSTKRLHEERVLCNELIWLAEWMQEPIEAKGLVFPPDSINYFDIDEIKQEPDAIVLVADIADEGTDSLCIPVGYCYGEKVYVMDVLFTNQPVEVTEPLTASFIDIWKPHKMVAESNNGGKGFARAVNNLIKHNKKLRWKVTTKNKHTRILMKSGIIKEKFYFRNDSKRSKMYVDFMVELMTYNMTGKVKHDDAPDAITMLAENTDTGKGWGW